MMSVHAQRHRRTHATWLMLRLGLLQSDHAKEGGWVEFRGSGGARGAERDEATIAGACRLAVVMTTSTELCGGGKWVKPVTPGRSWV